MRTLHNMILMPIKNSSKKQLPKESNKKQKPSAVEEEAGSAEKEDKVDDDEDFKFKKEDSKVAVTQLQYNNWEFADLQQAYDALLEFHIAARVLQLTVTFVAQQLL